MKNLFYLTSMWAIVLIAVAIFYYLVIYLPKKNNYTQQQELSKSQAITECQQFIFEAQNNGSLSGASSVTEMQKGINYLFETCMRSKGIN